MTTTEEVRDKFAEEWIEGEYFGNDDPETRAEFDRWLAQHDAEVAAKALRNAALLVESHIVRSSYKAQTEYVELLRGEARRVGRDA